MRVGQKRIYSSKDPISVCRERCDRSFSPRWSTTCRPEDFIGANVRINNGQAMESTVAESNECEIGFLPEKVSLIGRETNGRLFTNFDRGLSTPQ